MARLREEDYAYATARIRAIENKLITGQRLDRLMDAKTPMDAVKLLIELGYGLGNTDTAQGAADVFEKLLSDEMRKTYMLLREILPNPGAVLLFMRRNDYLNGKIILKSEFLGQEHEALTDAGTLEPAKLSRMVRDRALGEMPEAFREGVLEAVETYGRTGDPQVIDFIMDKAMYKNMVSDAKEIGEASILELVNLLQDTANLRIFIRARLLTKSREFLAKALLEGSKIPARTYLELADKPLEAALDEIRKMALSDLAEKLLEAVKGGSAISSVEKVLDDYLMSHVKKSKYVAMGIEPVIAYLFYKEAEIRNVRLAITGKINQIPQEIIRERLRAVYA